MSEPAPTKHPWWVILDLDPETRDRATIDRHWRIYVAATSGDGEDLLELNLAREAAYRAAGIAR